MQSEILIACLVCVVAVLAQEGNRGGSICSLPIEKGNGFFQLRRWGFEGGECRQFTFRGMGGNANNFR